MYSFFNANEFLPYQRLKIYLYKCSSSVKIMTMIQLYETVCNSMRMEHLVKNLTLYRAHY